jgi:hypothetical protein
MRCHYHPWSPPRSLHRDAEGEDRKIERERKTGTRRVGAKRDTTVERQRAIFLFLPVPAKML